MNHTTALPVRPNGIGELSALVGTTIGPTPWFEVTQERVDAFASSTEDHQWIHVDPDRAAESPFGGTIAHGLLTLSLGPFLSAQLVQASGFAHGLNYGYNKVRFPSPVPVGSRIRMRATVASVEPKPSGVHVVMAQVIEREGFDKPVLVAEAVSLLVAG
ncbi:MaoC family dehydratase (plasmid) [Prescottella equi]|uniref:MaoC family dehydratase n=1 Tax=Rhodococcus hoagii TaxID=43767 RepID=UPI002577AAE2|nr:MaoC family dehydratase [Prescottella equi]WJJ14460.1 MaoC family dehydratase [Prescottella equi]